MVSAKSAEHHGPVTATGKGVRATKISNRSTLTCDRERVCGSEKKCMCWPGNGNKYEANPTCPVSGHR